MTDTEYSDTDLFALVIGCGRIGFHFENLVGEARSHLGAIRAVTDRPIACMDTNFNKAKAAGKHFDIPYYGSLHDVYRNINSVNVVVVATPTDTHADIIHEILTDGLESDLIVCEKPITDTIDRAEWIIDTCKDYGVTLVVNHNRRWHPAYQYIKEQMDKEVERNIRAVVGYIYGDPITVGCHMTDLLNWYSYGDWDVCHYIDLECTKYKLVKIEIFTKNIQYRINEHCGDVYTWVNTPDDHGIFYPDEKKINGNPMINLYKEVLEIIDSKSDIQPSCDGNDGLRALELALKFHPDKIPRY